MQNFIVTFLFFLLSQELISQSFNGFALYNSQGDNTTFLIDENQNVAHTWAMNSECNYTVQLKKNGNLIRGIKNNGNILGGAAQGGKVQEVAPDGSIVWEYVYSSADFLSHHDLTLIGDNVLLTAWEVKSSSDLYDVGYVGNVGNSGKWPTHFIELEPDGNGSANIVWEWHIWDHLCQDVDPTKPNYVTDISDSPERINVNMIQVGGGPGGGGGDWFHVNGVDYNQELDQIAFSSRFASEIYIIDHSTTTAEASSSSGGNSGMGGDILYRWGNPNNYGMPGQQVIPNAVHDVRWIANDGRPNGGFLQIFNNSGISSNQSSIDGIETPKDPNNSYNYYRNNGQAFTPLSYTTRYACAFSASGQSASDRMSNGNIYVNASAGQNGAGVMYEVDTLGNIVWGPYNSQSQKGFRYECDYPGIIALRDYMNNISTTSCFDQTSSDEISKKNISIFPNPTRNFINIDFKSVGEGVKKIQILNSFGQVVLSEKNSNTNLIFTKRINLNSLSEGVYRVNLISSLGREFNQRFIYVK